MRIAIKWGLIFAAAVVLWTLIVHLLGIYTTRVQYAAVVDQLALVLPVAVLTLALLEQRRLLGGALPIGRGVLTGVAVAAISAPLTVAALWYYHHHVNPEWLSILVTYEQQKLASAGVPADQVAVRITQLQHSGTDRQQIIGGLVGTVAIGLVLSLLIAAALWTLGRIRRAIGQT